MTHIAHKLMRHVAAQGWAGRIVPIEHLSDLEERIVGSGLRGLIDDEFYRERLSGFAFRAPPELQNPRSIISSPYLCRRFTRSSTGREIGSPQFSPRPMSAIVRHPSASVLALAPFSARKAMKSQRRTCL